MFKKKPNIKTLSPLRSSDRRRIADRIIADYEVKARREASVRGDNNSQNDESHDGEAADKAAATAAHTALRNLILPDNALSAKFTTTHGPDLKEVSGTVYVGSHGKGEQRVLWISLYDRMYPSVYTLWRVPGILPLLLTPGVVVQKLKNGADLMTPGLAGPPFPPNAGKGALVAVADLDSPTVPVVVGTCDIDVSALKTTQGAKGRAVETFHWAGDELWDWSTSGKSGTMAPDKLDGWLQGEMEELVEDTGGLALDDEEETGEGGVSLTSDEPPPKRTDQRNKWIDGEDIAEVVDQDEEEESMTTKGIMLDAALSTPSTDRLLEIDEAFRNAFIYGVYHHRTTNPSHPKHGLVFPLSQSFVMSDLVKPFLPAFTEKQSKLLDIKRTSWKNIRKFIKTLDKEKLLLSKDRPGNEASVLDIDFKDRTFVDFQPYALPKKDNTGSKTADPSSTTSTTSDADSSLHQSLKILSLHRPKDILAPLFSRSSSDPKAYYTAPELTPIITSYLETENLIPSTNKRQATLNPFLASLLTPSSSPTATASLDAEILARGSIPRDALVTRILTQHCQPYHAILRTAPGTSASPSQSASAALLPPDVKPKAGGVPRILITLETRSGNKTVTRVSGMEAFSIGPAALAEELRKTCASSTSVEASRHGVKGMEVMVQGPQREAVVKACERRGVRKEWVEVVDKVKKKK